MAVSLTKDFKLLIAKSEKVKGWKGEKMAHASKGWKGEKMAHATKSEKPAYASFTR